MSFGKTQFNALFDGMHKYMFSAENLLRYTDNKVTDNTLKKQQQIKIKSKKNDNDSLFFPYQHDQLFWCFYIIIKGKEDYNINKDRIFKIEKDFKINAVEKLRLKKDILKINKLKISTIENELVNESRIGLMSLKALCILYEINVNYVVDRIYYKFQYGTDIKQISTIIKSDKKIGLYQDNITFNKKLEESYLLISDLSKPIKAISSYTVKELQIMSEKLLLSLLDNTGKKKGKKALYESILTKL
tara:strand:- start:265 stop:999 length:735 start_codon:yes stop_codon:yes gene_type:complete